MRVSSTPTIDIWIRRYFHGRCEFSRLMQTHTESAGLAVIICGGWSDDKSGDEIQCVINHKYSRVRLPTVIPVLWLGYSIWMHDLGSLSTDISCSTMGPTFTRRLHSALYYDGHFKVMQLLLEYEETNWRQHRDNSRLYRYCSITERTWTSSVGLMRHHDIRLPVLLDNDVEI